MSLLDDLFNQIPDEILAQMPTPEEVGEVLEEYGDMAEHLVMKCMFLVAMDAISPPEAIYHAFMSGAILERDKNKKERLDEIFGDLKLDGDTD